MACVWLCGASPAWAYSNACSAVNSVGSINTSFSTPDLGGGPGVAATTAAGEVYTLTVTTTGGVTLSFVEIQVGSTVNTVANAGNGTVVSLTAAGGEALVKQNRGATSGSGTVTITVTCTGVAPTVTNISPNSGSTAGGTSVTITGSQFSNASSVSFGGTFANSGNVVDDNTIVAITNPHVAGTGDVVVTTPAGSFTLNNAYTYTSSAPTVASVSPAVGTTTGGNSVVITGTNFTGATAVTFGGVAVQGFTVNSATSITVLTAAHAAGVVDVVVTTPTGTGTGSNLFTYQGAVTVTSVTPNSGPTTGGTNVTITGTNFTGAVQATFGSGLATNFVVVNSTTITATTPARGVNFTQTVNVNVSSPSGGGTGTNLFTYIAVPTVTSVSPNTGSTTGGTSIAITGTDFTGATSVTIGGTSVTFTVINATTIAATTPAHAAGAVNVAVTTPAGTGTGTGLFTYVAAAPAPTVTAVSPSSGTTAGGTTVTITGTNFTGVTVVKIGGAFATVWTLVNATTITATTPAHAAGPVNVDVTTPSGTGTGTNLFTYASAPAAPTVTAVSPNSGTTAGGTGVTISGTNLGGATTVTFGGTAATNVVVVNATTITATTPAHAAGAVDLVVTTQGGQATGNGIFTYVVANADSQKLRQMQLAATKFVAQTSGQAISGAVDSSITEAFGDGGEFVSQNGNALRFNFTAEPKSRAADAFDALANAGMPAKVPPAPAAREWQAWLDLRGTNWITKVETGDIRGDQVNATFGLGRKITSDLLVGVLGGVETFDYTSQLLAGRLKGTGWTAGGYFGWRPISTIRLDASVSRSELNYDITAASALGSAPGTRWLATVGLTGTYKHAAWQIEPSARLYVLWERQGAYVDNLGTAQAERGFTSGRASSGAKVSYLWTWSELSRLSPYLGLYGDYYYSSDDGMVIGAPPLAFVAGWSARVTSGLDVSLNNGLRLSVGGELGGIGGDHTMWSVRGRLNKPF
jgi:hypothetical protein